MTTSLMNHQISGSYCGASSVVVEAGDKILCPYGSEVKAISLPSGELTGVFRKHEGVVTSVCELSRSNTDASGLVVSSSKDGRIIVWRLRDFQVVQELSVGMDVYGFAIPSSSVDFYRASGNSSSSRGKGGSSSSTTSTSSSLGASDLYLLTTKASSKPDGGGASANEPRSYNKKGVHDGMQLKLVLYDTESQKVRKKITSVTSGRCLDVMSIREVDHLVVANKRKVLLVSTKTRNGPKFLSNTGNITCLATHDEKGLLITGHEYGEISIWHDIPHWMQSATPNTKEKGVKNKKNKKDKKRKGDSEGQATEEDDDEGAPALKPPVMTTFHWHAHAVRCLSFSGDGGYCYSGGEEGVLVMWQLATGIKSFIPRMGGTVAHVAADRGGGSMKVAVTTLDNAVHVVDVSRMREEWAMQSLFMASSDSREAVPHMEAIPWAVQGFRQRVRREPVNGLLVSTGAPGQLQAFDPHTRRVRWTHDVVQYTRVSRTEKHLKIYAPAVLDLAHQATSNGTVYLATLDARRGEDKTIVYALKFWVYDRAKAQYRLSAQVEEPHGAHRVTCMAFIPADTRATAMTPASATQQSTDYLVSGAEDGSVKVWRAVESINREDNSKQVLWTCAFSFRHKDHPVSALALSGDGSLLALAQQNVISFFGPLTVAFKSSLAIPRADHISFVSFVEPRFQVGTGEAYLLVGSPTKMVLFDLLTMTALWEKGSSERFVEFAVATRQDDTLFFGDEEEEDEDENDDGTISRQKRAYIAAAESNGKVSVFSIGSSAALAELKVQGRALGLEFGSIKTSSVEDDGSSPEASGVYVTTSLGLSFISNHADTAGLSITTTAAGARGSNKGKILLGQSSSVTAQSKAAALEVLGQSIADRNYSHAQEMEVDDGSGDVSHAKGHTETNADTRSLSTKSLPPVSSLVADFLGAHLRGATSANGVSAAPSSRDGLSAMLPGEQSTSGNARAAPTSSSSLARRRYSLSGLPIETDSSSEEEGGPVGRERNREQEEESRVKMKRRRSSSLENYQGAVQSAERDSLDFMKARTSNFNISF